MIVDSTALPEQAVRDILASSFQSAGQRCSALRILYVQKDVEKKMLEMLEGAMEALSRRRSMAAVDRCRPGDRRRSPEVDRRLCAGNGGQGQADRQARRARRRAFRARRTIFRVSGIEEMEREIFGPVLHVATFEADDIDRRDFLNQPKGLRPDLRAAHAHRGARAAHRRRRSCRQHLRQPQPDRRGRRLAAFRRRGAVGTGPKAGGPHYLRRFRKSAGCRPDRCRGAQGDGTAN